MNREQHEMYKDVSLPGILRKMFADLISSDPVVLQVFSFIAERTWNHEDKETEIGVMFSDLVESVKIKRKVLQKKSRFQEVHTNIERRHAERIVDKFLMMGLCYFRSFGPSKAFYITLRGKEVYVVIKKLKEAGSQTEENN
ncbi:hypothetical protein ABEV55_16195 [Aneurinibacillus thermoaerophilus]|uniref:hypothetical protein n=1 Tax=Aneurinibacillus thermoaerophilus TaxID=143495 RepID=UPI002E2448B6|nr:hypothetical protein [Aneurinibacillus thermoaerophilus]